MKYPVPFICLISVLLFTNCQKFSKEKRGDETVTKVSPTDNEMNTIIAESRKTFNTFYKEYESHKYYQRDFSVKYPFKTDPGNINDIEHIWLVRLTMEKNKYYGIVANEPFYIKKMKIGDKVMYDPKKISDWKYVENGYLVGGKSIIYLLKNDSRDERNAVLKQIDYRIKDFE